MLIKGVEFSEETIVGWAKNAGVSFEKPEPYQFKAGDVCKSEYGHLRIICKDANYNLVSNGPDGTFQSSGQDDFNRHLYEKIGELKDYIK